MQLAIALVPFAGIAFLWFTGVIRDLLGYREDQFFATVFPGSGIIFVALVFLVFVGAIQTLRFVFPGWVLLVSVYILIAVRQSNGSSSRSAGAGQ